MISVKVSESGISPQLTTLPNLNPYKGFLIGENFMKTENAGQAATDFIAQL
jgi:indole-3-glycerol phosphate synthase